MALKFMILCALVVVSYGYPHYGYGPVHPVAPANYNFDWAVQDSNSGNNFGQQESRNHDNTKGSYYVLLPDGRTQKVTYFVNGNSGFIADVQYDGQARFPAPHPHPRPVYGYK